MKIELILNFWTMWHNKVEDNIYTTQERREFSTRAAVQRRQF